MDSQSPQSGSPVQDSGDSTSDQPGVPHQPVAGLSDDAAATVISAEQQWLGESIPMGPGSTLCGRLFPPAPTIVDGVATTGSSTIQSPVGVELDHFIIDERIGVGGMGAVFRARDTRLGRGVALKVLSPVQSLDSGAVQRFRNEARAAAGLDHDNIARVFYVGEDRGLHFIAFEYITGTNVRDLIAAGGPLDPADAVNYTLQIASALVHTNSVGVVHRDVKPSNIIITPTGRAKLVDLGLARNPELNQTSEDLTSDGTTLGTFDYISPEQARDPRGVDVRCDIYSLGCTLYHMLTGEPPYPDGNAFQKLLDHQGKQPPDPARKNARVSERLSSVIRRMMASDPDKRFATPEALIRELMFVAEELGLKGVSSEGMVWMSAGALSGRNWEKHIGWMTTVVLLLIVVVVLRFQPVDRGGSVPTGDDFALVGDAAADNIAGSGPEVVDPASLPPLSDAVSGDGGTPASGSDDGVTQAADPPTVNSDGAEPSGAKGLPPVGRVVAGTSEKSAPKSVASQPDATRVEVPTETKPVEPSAVPAAAVPPSPVLVISVDGTRQRSYPTLNAALVDAVDGSQIVLRYNGVRVENPVRVAKKNITIRGAEGFRPGIEFRPKKTGDGVQPRMITVTAGPLQVINAELRMVVPRGESTSLAMLSLQRPEQVRLRNVVVTVVNPARHPVTVIELTPEPGAMRNMKKMMKEGMEIEPLEITIDRSLIRGHADLVRVRQIDPAELSLNHCVLGLGGSLLHATGIGGTAPKKRGVVELDLVHVTALMGENLIRLDSGEERRYVPSVRAHSRDSIFSHVNDRPLVSMAGNIDLEMFRGLLAWRNGEKNFFDDYSVFWWLGSDKDTIDFTGWKQQWSPAGSRNGTVAWQSPRATGDELAWDRLGLTDFRLADEAAPENRPVATDGTDAGANLSLLPEVSRVVVPTPE